jgi:hypothetical protein
VSHTAIAAVLARTDLALGERLVALSLASFANRDGRAFPGNAAAAARAGLGRSRYLEGRGHLVAGGLVAIESVGRGRGQSTTLTVLVVQFVSLGRTIGYSGSSCMAININSASVSHASSNPSATASRPEFVPSTPIPISVGADDPDRRAALRRNARLARFGGGGARRAHGPQPEQQQGEPSSRSSRYLAHVSLNLSRRATREARERGRSPGRPCGEDEPDVAAGHLDAVGVRDQLTSPVDDAVALRVDARQPHLLGRERPREIVAERAAAGPAQARVFARPAAGVHDAPGDVDGHQRRRARSDRPERAAPIETACETRSGPRGGEGAGEVTATAVADQCDAAAVGAR